MEVEVVVAVAAKAGRVGTGGKPNEPGRENGGGHDAEGVEVPSDELLVLVVASGDNGA